MTTTPPHSGDTAEPYRPSNGSEGMEFEHRFCNRCERERLWREDDFENDACGIHTWATAVSVDHPRYPTEWVQDERGPRCTAFVEEGKALPEVYERDLARYEAAMAEMRTTLTNGGPHAND